MKISLNKPLIGTIYSLGSNPVAEIISNAGFDWVLIDMEHSTLSLDTVQTTLQVMGDKILKIVRVPGNDEIWIKRVLDTGCDGILVPMIKNAEEAAKAINSSRYPTMGQRSVGVARAHKFGAAFKEYVTRANDELIIMIQIEHIEAVKNIDSILAVPGVESIFIGPYDLSASMGLTGQVDHPEVRAAIDLVKKKCNASGIPYGIFGMSPESLENEINGGCTFLLCGADVSLISGVYNDMKAKLKRKG
jgi:2-dehydro-3-deoxyglucarate aldolase/4-hydroxy-2-oxoheptanedioate aldolase